MLLSRNKSWQVLLTFLVWSMPLLAQLEDANTKTKAECAKYAQTPLPSEATPLPPPKQWPACASYRLYSGIGVTVDFAAARKCAWLERQATQAGLEPRFTASSVFGGSAMLTVLYANGEGLEENFPLAIRFACESGGAPAEIGGRVESLEARKDSKGMQKSEFTFCDDTTSGFMMGFCSAVNEEERTHDRDGIFNRLTLSWPALQKESFARALSLQAKYAEAHARGEIDLSGTARAMFEIDAESSLKDDFLEAVTAFEAGNLPSASTAKAAKADEELNRAYQYSIRTAEKHKSEYGAIQPDGIRQAERAWLKYRDAWLDFAAKRYPSVPPNAWLQLLTADRTLILSGKSCGTLEDCGGEDQGSPHPLP
jgi:uncharacterized protein YecT (DUF1311 family)